MGQTKFCKKSNNLKKNFVFRPYKKLHQSHLFCNWFSNAIVFTQSKISIMKLCFECHCQMMNSICILASLLAAVASGRVAWIFPLTYDQNPNKTGQNGCLQNVLTVIIHKIIGDTKC